MGIIFVLATKKIISGEGCPSDLPTLINYLFQLNSPLNILSYSYRWTNTLFVDARSVLELLSEKPTVEARAGAGELVVKRGKINFNQVKFSHNPDGDSLLLENLTFCISPGQTVAIIGESGGGKSTIFRLLYRFYDIKSGLISIDGQDINEVTAESLCSSLGIVPQVNLAWVYPISGHIAFRWYRDVQYSIWFCNCIWQGYPQL